MNLHEKVVLDLFDHNNDSVLDAAERKELHAVEQLAEASRETIFDQDESVVEAINELWLARVMDANRTRLLADRKELSALFGFG